MQEIAAGRNTIWVPSPVVPLMPFIPLVPLYPCIACTYRIQIQSDSSMHAYMIQEVVRRKANSAEQPATR